MPVGYYNIIDKETQQKRQPTKGENDLYLKQAEDLLKAAKDCKPFINITFDKDYTKIDFENPFLKLSKNQIVALFNAHENDLNHPIVLYIEENGGVEGFFSIDNSESIIDEGYENIGEAGIKKVTMIISDKLFKSLGYPDVEELPGEINNIIRLLKNHIPNQQPGGVYILMKTIASLEKSLTEIPFAHNTISGKDHLIEIDFSRKGKFLGIFKKMFLK